MNDNKQEAVLAYFLIGGSLTVLKCINMFHTTELRKVVSRLKKKGYIFCEEWLENYEGERYKEYWLDRSKKQPLPMDNIKFAPSGRLLCSAK